jgi:acyl-CoA synthetase (AMP-forming)/AMP-acid ligase II
MLDAFFWQAASSPRKPFIVCGAQDFVDYGSAARIVLRIRDALRAVDGPVVLFAENTPHFVFVFVACISLELDVYIFSESDIDEGVYRWLQLRGVQTIDRTALEGISRGAAAADANPLPPPALVAPPAFEQAPDTRRASVIGFPSSGTTGAKKLLRYRYGTLHKRAMLMAEAYGLDDQDRFLCTSTVAHAHGINVHVIPAIVLGATLGLVPLTTMSVRRVVTTHQALGTTVFSALPSLYTLLLRFEANLRFTSPKLVLSGSERLESQVKTAFEERYGVELVDQFGCAETGPVSRLSHVHDERYLGHVFDGKTVTFLPTPIPQLYRVAVRSTTMVDEIVDASGDIESPEELVLNDLVYRDPHGMRVLGRAESVISVGDRAASLEDLERILERSFAGTDFLAIKRGDDSYDVFYAGPCDVDPVRVRSLLIPPPCSVSRLSAIPRNAAGKKLRSSTGVSSWLAKSMSSHVSS